MKYKFDKRIFLISLLVFILAFYLLRRRTEGFTTKTSYSQINQDTNVLKHFGNKKGGYFIEIGANDGIHYSNTYLLEKEFDWKGICIEPVPYLYNKLKQNRTCITIPSAVYDTDNETVTLVEANEKGLSGIIDDIDKHKQVLKNNNGKFQAKTKTLTTILKENGSPKYIDYMSLDTEGSELKILQGINFNEYKFGYINVEHNYIEPRRSDMKNLLLDNGYKYAGENKFDDIYTLNQDESFSKQDQNDLNKIEQQLLPYHNRTSTPSKIGYSFTDMIKGNGWFVRTNDNEKFKRIKELCNTDTGLMCTYFNKYGYKKPFDIRALYNLIRKEISTKTPRHTLIVHLRVGDVFERKLKNYFKPLNFYETLKIPENVKFVHIYAGAHNTINLSSSAEYVSQIKHIFEARGYTVMLKLGGDPEKAIVEMAKASYFVRSGGASSYSELIEKLVTMNGGIEITQ